jgi:hypothetical protein
MNIGTKSVLFGVHQFLLHPFMLAIGWWKAYGFRAVPIGHRTVWDDTKVGRTAVLRRARRREVRARLLDPRLWVAFAVHDLGYLGKPNMDGPEGETHPELGASIMRRLFGEAWGDLVLLHSRYYSKKLGRPVSPLCFADKWVIVLEPAWLYLPRVWLSGELREFVANGQNRVRGSSAGLTESEAADLLSGEALRWHRGMVSYMRRWIAEHQDGKPDTWTRVRHAEPAA